MDDGLFLDEKRLRLGAGGTSQDDKSQQAGAAELLSLMSMGKKALV
ncbi:MAG TPA: hypothetical protein VN004_11915 [Pseudorhodoplanes sp.]|nr:hypothetical protein [Pseudorhodoplanes sp.]